MSRSRALAFCLTHVAFNLKLSVASCESQACDSQDITLLWQTPLHLHPDKLKTKEPVAIASLTVEQLAKRDDVVKKHSSAVGEVTNKVGVVRHGLIDGSNGARQTLNATEEAEVLNEVMMPERTAIPFHFGFITGILFGCLAPVVCTFTLNLCAKKFVGKLVENAIESYSPEVVGTQVSFDSVAVGIFRGYIHIHNMKVANPESSPPYKSPHILQADTVTVDIDMERLITSMFHIIEVECLEFVNVSLNYEAKNVVWNKKSNIHDIMDYLEKGDEEDKEKNEPESSPSSTSKKNTEPKEPDEKKDEKKEKKEAIVSWKKNGKFVGSMSGTSLTWPSGHITPFSKDKAGKKISMNFNGKDYIGELRDDGTLHWNDGDIWENQATSTLQKLFLRKLRIEDVKGRAIIKGISMTLKVPDLKSADFSSVYSCHTVRSVIRQLTKQLAKNAIENAIGL